MLTISKSSLAQRLHCCLPAPGGISKEELGRSTWTMMHTLAAQWPQQPTLQQQKDLDTLVCEMPHSMRCAVGLDNAQ